MKKENGLSIIFQNKKLFIFINYLSFIILSLLVSFIGNFSLTNTFVILGYALIISYIVMIVYLYNRD